MTPMHKYEDEVREKRIMRFKKLRTEIIAEEYNSAKASLRVIETCDSILEELRHGYYDEGRMNLRLAASANTTF